nr:PREDICTED: complement factor D [Apteryx mantelli mantelli]
MRLCGPKAQKSAVLARRQPPPHLNALLPAETSTGRIPAVPAGAGTRVAASGQSLQLAGCCPKPGAGAPGPCSSSRRAPRRRLSCRDGKLFQVLLGAHSLTEPEPHKRLYRVRAQIPHPGSNVHNNKDDLLLLQLEEKAELNAHVQVLRFQREDRDVPADTVCEAAGWGTVSHSGRRPDKLQQVERPVISRDACNHRTRHDHTITENMMCTDSRKKDTCKGDSGSPLVCNGVAEAVVTAGSRVCGNYKKPGIYTRIAPYAAWIDSVMASVSGEGAP